MIFPAMHVPWLPLSPAAELPAFSLVRGNFSTVRGTVRTRASWNIISCFTVHLVFVVIHPSTASLFTISTFHSHSFVRYLHILSLL